MRVIAGKAKGLHLRAPSTSRVRPATDKVKGAIFNILGNIEGVRALDLFAGTGSVGIEALSRGARECHFVESDRATVRVVEKNLDHCRLKDLAQVWNMPVSQGISKLSRKNKSFDLVFVDPPYDRSYVNSTLEMLAQSPLLGENTVVVVEHSPREMPQEGKLAVIDQRRYGQTTISFLKVKSKKL